MMKFSELFNLTNNCKSKVLLEHVLFDKQVHYCDRLHIINDSDRIGVVLKNQEIFIDKQDIRLAQTKDNMYMISDGKLTITIIVNKM